MSKNSKKKVAGCYPKAGFSRNPTSFEAMTKEKKDARRYLVAAIEPSYFVKQKNFPTFGKADKYAKEQAEINGIDVGIFQRDERMKIREHPSRVWSGDAYGHAKVNPIWERK